MFVITDAEWIRLGTNVRQLIVNNKKSFKTTLKLRKSFLHCSNPQEELPLQARPEECREKSTREKLDLGHI